MFRSGLRLQSGLPALDSRASSEHPAAGHGTCSLLQPWSGHGLLPGSCSDPARPLVRNAGHCSTPPAVSSLFPPAPSIYNPENLLPVWCSCSHASAAHSSCGWFQPLFADLRERGSSLASGRCPPPSLRG